MADSLRASAAGLVLVDRARERKGWTKTVTIAWWSEALTTRSTLKRFWRQIPIQKEAFIQICRVVGIEDWQAIADFDSAPIDSQDEILPPPEYGARPDIHGFYGRAQELAQLEQWVLLEHSRLVVLFGEPGIGKTDLVTVFADQDQIQETFQICRQSLRHAPLLPELLALLFKQMPSPSGSPPQNLWSPVSDVLTRHRYLVILDDVEAIFQAGRPVGRYQPGYEDYGEWFRHLGTSPHQSCVIVISREPLQEITSLESRSRKVRSLSLKGLSINDAQTLLQHHGLTDPMVWDTLLKQYGSSPQILTLIANIITDLFNRSVLKFLRSCGTIVIPPTVEDVLRTQFKRLSESEKSVLQAIASNEQAISFSQIQALSSVTPAELPDVLLSLLKRSLVERLIDPCADDEVRFTLQPVIKKYVLRSQAMRPPIE